jgi:hypothetical protein
VIQGERNHRGALMFICTSDEDGTGAVLEVPVWMFDRAVRGYFLSGSTASVNLSALRALDVCSSAPFGQTM